MHRRTLLTSAAAIAAVSATTVAALLSANTRAYAATTVLKIGVDLTLTGPGVDSAIAVKNGITMAFDAANKGNAVPGYTFEMDVMDDATTTAGGYDPAQGATNARRMVADPQVIAAVGPMSSGIGKAMAPILSEGALAIITPASTNPAITDPKFAAEFRPAGKAIYFRTVTTDAFQGPNMANFMAEKLDVKSVYLLDDSGAYGVGMVDAFQKQAEAKGMKVLGRDRLDPKAADYTAVITKIKSLNPDAIYYGGYGQAGTKVAKETYDILPKMIKAAGDGVMDPYFLRGAGFPAVQGWYATLASPHLTGDQKAAEFVKDYTGRFGVSPGDYSITAYDASLVIIDAIKRVAASGKPVTRAAVRDAIQSAKVPTIQGVVSFDPNGDLLDRTVSVFQIQQDTKARQDDVSAQYKYIGVAPQV